MYTPDPDRQAQRHRSQAWLADRPQNSARRAAAVELGRQPPAKKPPDRGLRRQWVDCSHPPRSGPGPAAIERLSGRRPQPMGSPASSNPASRFIAFQSPRPRGSAKRRRHRYVFLGIELGGRPRSGGIPDYDAMAASPLFTDGIARVEEMAARTRPALMCSELEPLTSHRCLLVGRRLVERGNDLARILRDGTTEPNAATEDRLLALTPADRCGPFCTEDEHTTLARNPFSRRRRRK